MDKILRALRKLGQTETTTIATVADMTLIIVDDAFAVIVEGEDEIFTVSSVSKKALVAIYTLFIHGDEGNESLYDLAEPLMPKDEINSVFRCIP